MIYNSLPCGSKDIYLKGPNTVYISLKLDNFDLHGEWNIAPVHIYGWGNFLFANDRNLSRYHKKPLKFILFV